MAVELGDIVGQIGAGSYRLVKGKDVDISQANDGSSHVIADDDIFIIDDSATGTQASTKYITGSQLKTYIGSYTHPNHSGEVTSTGDGATVITDNVVDEANLKVSNSPTNGQFLQAQSGETGGLKWANSSGGATTYKELDGMFALNTQTNGDETLDGNHDYIQYETLDINDTIDIANGVTLDIAPKDSSADEKVRIDSRKQMDIDIRAKINDLHNRFNFLKNDLGVLVGLKHNALLNKLGEKEYLNAEEIKELEWKEATSIGNVTYNSTTEYWTFPIGHGLQVNSPVRFRIVTINPVEFESGATKTYYVHSLSGSRDLKLKSSISASTALRGTSNTDSNWVAVNIDGFIGFSAYDNSSTGLPYYPLVNEENYTDGGVCSIDSQMTELSCGKAGGTWYE